MTKSKLSKAIEAVIWVAALAVLAISLVLAGLRKVRASGPTFSTIDFPGAGVSQFACVFRVLR